MAEYKKRKDGNIWKVFKKVIVAGIELWSCIGFYATGQAADAAIRKDRGDK